jgi:hypothetical protein
MSVKQAINGVKPGWWSFSPSKISFPSQGDVISRAFCTAAEAAVQQQNAFLGLLTFLLSSLLPSVH